MVEADLTLTNKVGLHARPAASLVKTAAKYISKVNLKGNGKIVDGKSIVMVMTMGMKQGSTVTVMVDGPDEKECLAAIKELIENKFYEE